MPAFFLLLQERAGTSEIAIQTDSPRANLTIVEFRNTHPYTENRARPLAHSALALAQLPVRLFRALLCQECCELPSLILRHQLSGQQRLTRAYPRFSLQHDLLRP